MSDTTDVEALAADEDDLRRRLHDVASTTVVDPDAWEKIQERLVSRRRQVPSARRPLAAAVAIAVVAVVAALAAVTRHEGSAVDTIPGTTTTERDRDRTTTTSTNPRSSTTTTSPGSQVPPGIDSPRGSSAETGTGRAQAGQAGSGQPAPAGGGPADTRPGAPPPEPSPPPRYEASLSSTVVAPGDTVTVRSVTPCLHDDDMMYVIEELRRDGVRVYDIPGPVWPGPPGEWVWTYVTSPDQAPGLYTARFTCYGQGEVGGMQVVFEYEPLSFTVEAP